MDIALLLRSGRVSLFQCALASGVTLGGILQSCAEAVVKHLGAAFARIWVLTKDQRFLELCASAGVYTNLDGAHRLVPVGHLKIGLIAHP